MFSGYVPGTYFKATTTFSDPSPRRFSNQAIPMPSFDKNILSFKSFNKFHGRYCGQFVRRLHCDSLAIKIAASNFLTIVEYYFPMKARPSFRPDLEHESQRPIREGEAFYPAV